MNGATHLFIAQHADFAVQQNGAADPRGDVYLSIAVLEVRTEFPEGAVDAGQNELPARQRPVGGRLRLLIATAFRLQRSDRRLYFVEGLRRLAAQQ